MSESPFFRTPLGKQRVHGSQTLAKSARWHFYPNFSLIQDKLSLKKSLLVRCEILGLFGNTVTADRMYFHHNGDKLTQQVQTPLSLKVK